MEKKRTILGLDLGIASVGWCLYQLDDDNNPERIVDMGSFVFDQIEDGKTGQTENINRRTKRSMRRQRRRRVRRLKDCRYLFLKTFNIDFLSLVSERKVELNPFEIKKKGLDQKLTPEELCVALYHYCKYRGFKSNRKAVDEADKESGKLLKQIGDLKRELQMANTTNRPVFVTEELLKRNEDRTVPGKRMHNAKDEYLLTVSRDMYLEEIEYLLNTQIHFGVIDENFKNEFIKLFTRQRDFSDGPDESSKYHVDMNKVIGKCEFDGKPRAPKESMSAKRFVLLSSLSNLRYKTKEDHETYKRLSPEQIVTVEKKAIEKSSLSYADIFKWLKIDVLSVKGLAISRKEYKKEWIDFVKAENIEGRSLNQVESEKLSDRIQKKTFSKTLFKNSDTILSLKKNLKGCPEAREYLDDDAFLDGVTEILLRCKTDQRIEDECAKNNWPTFVVEAIKQCKDCNRVIDLSTDICCRLIPYLRQGKTYDDAMAAIGLSHSLKGKAKYADDEIPHIPEINEALRNMGIRLTNPVVRHTLVQMRKVVNAVIDTYGCPESFSVELARELKKSFKDRMEIRNDQLSNQEGNIREKTEILEKFGENFASITQVTRDSLLRYRLYKQQHGYSPYSNKMIPPNDIFDGKKYQVDHILPYSRSFNDSFDNKVLVETEKNQEKGNRTPLEWLTGGSSKVLYDFLDQCYLPLAKRNNLLAKDISSDFLSKDFEDTSYLSKLTKELIEYYLLPEGKICRTVSGSITSQLRILWGLSGRVHSYYSSYEKDLYRAKFIDEYLFSGIELKAAKEGELPTGVTFHFSMRRNDFPIEVDEKKNDKKAQEIEIQNKNLAIFIRDYYLFFQQRFDVFGCKGKPIDALYQAINYESVNDADSSRREAGLYVLGCVLNQIYKDINAKNRDNDLHHALDAAVIAAVNPSIIKKFAEFNKRKETEAIDYATGEVGLCMSLPYPGFREEVLTRVYERDQNKLVGYLNRLPAYQEHPLEGKRDVHVLWPVRLPKKDVVGAISCETIYGVRKGTGQLTRKLSADKLTDKNVENIVDKDGGNNAVYLACKEWLKNKQGRKFPILPKKGVFIRSVKIVVASSPKGKVDLSNDRYAENSDVVRVDVYKKNTDPNTLYMVPVYYYQIFKERMNRVDTRGKGLGTAAMKCSDLDYTITWKQGEVGTTLIKGSELNESYHCIALLPRNSLIFIETNSGCGYAYSGGCTSGAFEIYSLLRDASDLIDSRIIRSLKDRCRITISTIKKIVVHNITVLGKIS